MTPATLAQIADALEAAAGAATTANSTRAGYWRRIALAAEDLVGSATSANATTPGYMLRAALAMESIEGGSGAEENRNTYGYLKRVTDALELNAGVTAGELAQRFLTAALAYTADSGEPDALTDPVVTVTSAAGAVPEFEVATLAEYMGHWLDVQVADNATEDFSVLAQDISYQIQMNDLPPGSITNIELQTEGYTNPTGAWSIRFRIRRDDGAVSGWDAVSGTVTGSTAVLATVTGTAKHTSYDTATYSGLGGRMTANVGGNRGARATVAVTGKRHWEVTIEQLSAVAGNKFVMGMCDLAADMSASVLPGSSGALGAGIRVADNSNNITQLRNGSVASTTNMGSPIAVGDVYVMEFDTVANTVSFWRHRAGVNTLIYTTTLTSQIPTDWVPTVQGYNTDDRVSVNFGAGAWVKTPTTDYEGW